MRSSIRTSIPGRPALIGLPAFIRLPVICGLTFALIGLLASMAPASDDRATQDPIPRLVRDLGSESFATREKATRELVDLGIVTRDALLAASNDPDAEIRMRVRAILATVSESEFQRRLEAFAVDYDGSHKQTLPGWESFSALFGTSPLARQLFVEMQRSEPELLAEFSKGSKLASEALEARCQAFFQQPPQGHRNDFFSVGTIASLLFVGSAEGVDVDEQYCLNLYPALLYQIYPKNIRTSPTSPWAPMMKKMVGLWVVKDANPAATNANLLCSASLELKTETLAVATRVLSNQQSQSSTRQMAVLMLGRFGDKEHLKMLEKLLEDTTICGAAQVNNPPRQVEVQIRDVVLAVLVHLTNQNLRDYGFLSIQYQPTTLFQSGTLHFDDPAQRDAALKKWSAWRAEHPSS